MARRVSSIVIAAALAIAVARLAIPTSNPAAGEPVVIARVNAGGNAVPAQLPWTADIGTTPSPWVNAKHTRTAKTAHSIDVSDESLPEGTPPELFFDERFDPHPSRTRPEMHWSFPVPAAAYEVRLYFAEIFKGTQAAGARLFDVGIEGETLLDDSDVFAVLAGYKPVLKQSRVPAD